ncbi:MFS transporter [Sphingomonas histidinilytica]|uniref:Predicted arabinose efflux permease, MFS family n=1 Tax=Rhizorhabdus histidinilytica TaxID=439228 RepID=A0A1T5G106_9SPHN|nr:MFS transporter [Rhizorhabdus histidinilytica]MBO9378410.1 MFS transporter [Rhizorhabdus histidinilytica]SKC02143.1 Predicted arabinose efflux permease, MFS family [Rhizorhabdus histidinilytica]
MAIAVDANQPEGRRLRGFIAEAPTPTARARAFLALLLVLVPPVFTAMMGTPVVPIIPAVAKHFGGGDAGAFAAQMMVTVPCIGVIIGGPVAGWLIERIGIRAVIIGSAVLMGLAGMAGAVVHDIVPFLFSRLLVGFGAAGGYTALLTLAGLLFQGRTLARVLGYQASVAAVVSMGSIMISGYIAEHVEWRVSYGLYALVLLFVPLALLGRWPAQPVSVQARAAGAGAFGRIWPILLIMIPIYAAAFMSVVQGSFMMTANGITKPTLQSTLISMATIMFTISSWNYGRLRSRLSGPMTFVVALLLLGGGIVLMGSLHPVWAMGLSCAMMGAGAGIATPYLSQQILERVTAEQRGRAVGFIAPAHYLGEFANPFIMHPLRMAIGIHAAFILFGAFIMLGALFAFRANRKPASADPESAPEPVAAA